MISNGARPRSLAYKRSACGKSACLHASTPFANLPPMKPERGYEALRRHRWSQPGLSYFVTLCTAERTPGLADAGIASAIRTEVMACQADGHWRVRGAVIMPDHLHLLVVLTGTLSLGRVVARLKAKTRESLASASGADVAGLTWQGNYFEHRLRPDEPVEEVLRYLFMNPYRAGLIEGTDSYPWYWLHPEEAAWFTPRLLDDERPFPEWLR